MIPRALAALALALGLAACARNDLDEPPMPLGDFVLGHNIAVAENVQMVPISRPATPEEWEGAIQKAVDARFGYHRYPGTRIFNIGISVDAYALAPPGIPVVAAPKSVLVVTANIWDDGAGARLNDEGHQITVFEGLSGETVIGTGLTRSKAQQMEALSFNAVRKVEEWLLENPEWFGMTKAELQAALDARAKAMAVPEVVVEVGAEVAAEGGSEAGVPTDVPAGEDAN
ncbi:hypothetical protein [Pseudogemmobacter sonorensis]|uniref:hypothetical protein n=1 Tax=Pseudogemmobacter sonorensis TaxID=2989681 RepID=UPI003691A19E